LKKYKDYTTNHHGFGLMNLIWESFRTQDPCESKLVSPCKPGILSNPNLGVLWNLKFTGIPFRSSWIYNRLPTRFDYQPIIDPCGSK